MRIGSNPISMTQEEFANIVNADIRKWKKMLGDYNIKPQQIEKRQSPLTFL